MSDFEIPADELAALRELRALVGEMIAANYARGIGTLSAYVAAKDRMIDKYLEHFDGRTREDLQRHPSDFERSRR